jgi:hypothetical protein
MSETFGADDIGNTLSMMEQDLKGKTFENKYWSPASDFEGNVKLRFLPLLKTFGEKIFYAKLRIHWLNKRPYMCLAQTLADKNGNVHEVENCPLCAKSKQLYNLGGDNRDSEERLLAASIGVKDSYVARIVVRGRKNESGDDVEAVPVFYRFGKTIFESLLNFIKSNEFGNFLDVKEGRDFILSKSGTGRNVKYSGSYLSPTVTPVFSDKDKLQTLLNELQKMNYNQLVEFVSEAEMKKALAEFLNPGEEDRQDESAPVKKDDGPAPKKEEKKEEGGGNEIDDLLANF